MSPDAPRPDVPLRIVVLVKHVPDVLAGAGFGPGHLTDRAGQGLLSELDEYPLEAARRLSEAVGAEVVALTVGPPAARGALTRALQMGAHSAVLVADDALRGSDATATSLVLARAIQRLGRVDLVLTGAASADAGTSLVPVQVAARLGVPALTFAAALDVTGGTATIRRDDEREAVTLTARLPALVSLTDRADPPRYPSFAQILAARRREVREWDLAALEVAPDAVGATGSWTQVRTVTAEPPRPPGRVITDAGDAGTALVAFLAERHLI